MKAGRCCVGGVESSFVDRRLGMRGGGGGGGVGWESVVGPLLVEEPLEVAASAGGESLRERERCVGLTCYDIVPALFLLNALS